MDNTLTVGAKLGAFGGEISVNVKKAGEAVVNFFVGLVDWTVATIQEGTRIPKSSDYEN